MSRNQASIGRLRGRDRMLAASILALGSICGVAHAAPADTVTLWHNYGTEVEATALADVVAGFQRSAPQIQVNVVSQPADNYFALLTTASISHRAPDIAVMWTGIWTLKYAKLLTDLRPLLPAEPLAQIKGLNWASADYDTSKSLYVVPFEDQFYLGFYNKALLRKAGLDGPPRDWAELADACAKLRGVGVVPLLYGSDSQALSSEFYPFYDMSYLMSAVYPVGDWPGFAKGTITWTDAPVQAQVQKWADLHGKGCTNPDVLTATDIPGKFKAGQAAMIVGGNWNLQQLSDAMHDDLGVFPLPFGDRPVTGVIQMPGAGLAILKSSKNKQAAASFLAYLMSPEAQTILAKDGLIPARKGFAPTNPLYAGLLDLSVSKGFTQYPMLDNVMQTSVVDTGQRVLDAAFAGQMTVAEALRKMKDTFENLPADDKR